MKHFVIAALALHGADLATTLAGLRMGYAESGAVAGPALEALGWIGLATIPLIGLAVQAAVIRWLLPRRFRRVGYALVLGLLVIPVVANLATIV